MKKFILALALLFVAGKASVKAQVSVRFYFYPSANVYYDPVRTEYYYYDPPRTSWVTVRTLPTTIHIDRTYNVIYYKGRDPWKYNKSHKAKYYKAKKPKKH